MSAQPWELLGDLLKKAGPADPADVAGVDQTAAYYAEMFGKFGISLRDERDAFVALTAVAVAAASLHVAANNGRIPVPCSVNGRTVLRALCFAIAHHVPEEVRP